jgi:hypothetical protein
MASTLCILVDAFGNWTLYARAQHCLTIVFKDRTFEKKAEAYDGLDVYRLAGYPPPWDGIRHKQVLNDVRSRQPR